MPQRLDLLKASRVIARFVWLMVATIACATLYRLSAAESAAPGATNHWAFQRLQAPSLPAAASRNLAAPVDHFVRAKLQAVGLDLSAPASPATLLRRLSFDVRGLPPSVAELEEFMHDPSAENYVRFVDRWLASPHYGERWGRHWLDVVRFAESHGFETNLPRDNAWPYRDYVIQALNQDKPYPQFIAEQLAGDLLQADEATGFLVGGPWDAVKSPDVVLTRNQRADEVHDMVSTTTATFLGLTVGCARCHDHKFDPVTQVDYYRVAGIFAGVEHGDRPWPTPVSVATQKALAQMRVRASALDHELGRLEPLAQPAQSSLEPEAPPESRGEPAVVKDNPVRARAAVHALWNVERFAPVRAASVRFVIETTTDIEACLDELEVYSAEVPARNVAAAAEGGVASASGTFANSELHKLHHVNDSIYGNSRSWIADRPGAAWVQVDFRKPESIDLVIWARDREGKFSDRLPVKYRIEITTPEGARQTVASNLDRQPYVAGRKRERNPEAYHIPPPNWERWRELSAEREAVREELGRVPATPSVYAGRFVVPPATHRLHRGDPMFPREAVVPGAIQGLGHTLELSQESDHAARRLALARWLADEQNPLTARVIVNRVWHYHFGQGIVATPSDFGLNGARPTNQELLDWLATEFIRQGWRLKPLHRLILLSDTYRQASAANPRALQLDAGNRLQWRFSPRRMEAEAIRDTVLSVSGALDLRMGGPGYDVFEPNDNYVRVYNPKASFSRREWRRMIYQRKPRMQQDATFGSFDCPDGGQMMPARHSSTTPLQALNLLNSPFMVQQAELTAARIVAEAGPDLSAQLNWFFQLALQRLPEPGELTEARELVEAHGWPALCRAVFNSNEFLYVF